MQEFIDAIDRLPLILKAVIALFVDIIWHIYRILCALKDNDMTALIVAIVLLVIPFTAIFDLVMILVNGTVWRYRSAA